MSECWLVSVAERGGARLVIINRQIKAPSLFSTTDSSCTLTRSHFIQETIQATLVSAAFFSPLSSQAMITDPKTGIALPSPGEIESAIPSDWSAFENTFVDGDKSQFARLDTTPDSLFYTDARFVEHVDENAVRKMTEYISRDAIRPNDTVLDLCSSWTSHIDTSMVKPKECGWVGHESTGARGKSYIIILECTRLECQSETAISRQFLQCCTVPTEYRLSYSTVGCIKGSGPSATTRWKCTCRLFQSTLSQQGDVRFGLICPSYNTNDSLNITLFLGCRDLDGCG